LLAGELPAELSFSLDRPPQPQFGDFSTNAALIASSRAQRKPREVAQQLVAALGDVSGLCQRVEIAGPGFINFHLGPSWLHELIATVLKNGELSAGNLGQGQRVQVEFVSANPNGPIHIGHGRGGVIGDVLARVLAAAGYDVQREFYINDAAMSSQMVLFAQSLEVRYRQLCGEKVELPENGYKGEYVIDLARELLAEHGETLRTLPGGERLAQFLELGKVKMLSWQRSTLSALGIEFDQWFSEQSLHDAGKVQEAIDRLREGGYTTEADGALWLKTTAFGDEQDRVLVRSNGVTTYLASDLAYHFGKCDRGFARSLDIWGADHHGHISRMKAGLAAVGLDPDRLDVLLYQIVRLFRDGVEVKVSKREGDIITVSEVIEEVGVDATRFFFLMRSHDSRLDFDLDLAKKQSADNPVYYVQYGHARICSILREAEERTVGAALSPDEVTLELLTHPQEIALMRKLAELPNEIELAAQRYEVHRLTRYATDLAAAFHGFYTECRVLGEAAALTAARLALVRATQLVLKQVLGLLGVGAPERM